MATEATPMTGEAELAWEIVQLFPAQGEWSEADYLALTDGTNHLVELSDGRVEVLPMPTEKHQNIISYLFYSVFLPLAQKIGGKAVFAALRVRLWEEKFREPDIVFLRSADDARRHNEYWDGADLVVEVVSGDAKDRERDLVTKRREYAQAGILEYWIVDPETGTIIVLRLENDHYIEHGQFARGMTASSALFDGLQVDVNAMLNAE